jgi:hypothetical protein
MVISKYAHLIKEHPNLSMPPFEVPPHHQAAVALALTEVKRSATTEKGDRWCHTPDPLNLIIEAGLRGRILGEGTAAPGGILLPCGAHSGQSL